jgi:hypothetical protein
VYNELEKSLFEKRFHGSYNITGIDFQIQYALNAALDLVKQHNPIEALTLEGIEDLDLNLFQTDNIYVQVKTSINQWHLNDVSNPISTFILHNKATVKANRFELILNFEPRDSIKRLFSESVPIFEKDDLVSQILKHKVIKGKKITKEQIEGVISQTELKYIQKTELVEHSKRKLVSLLDIHPAEAYSFLLSLLYQFIDWSIERKTITKSDILNFKVRFSENKARSENFEAYGRNLIDRISWKKDYQPLDYFVGKKTRFGHISLGLDVRRDKWLTNIDKIFDNINVCVIREASGQGKSTLAFRYVYENWNPEYSYEIKTIENAEQAEQISNYLKALAELGLPVNVLIDDINYTKKYFGIVLENCASHHINFLITTRNDSYFRYGNTEQVSLEFLIPEFNRNEAKLIFENLKKEKKIHQNVISSEWAYETIDSPKCLIEFIFLITNGEMLRDRLSQQVRDFQRNNDDLVIDFVRKVLIAEACKTPLSLNQIIAKDNSVVDYQKIVKQINDEFITIEDGKIKGYHWVRTSHLLEILHEGFANSAVTALKTCPLIGDNELSSFIGNLSEIVSFDLDIFIMHSKTIYETIDLSTCLSFLEGVFKLGENQFFRDNLEVYEEGYTKFNEGVLFLFNSKYLPTKSINIFDSFGQNENFQEFKELSNKFKNKRRGFHYVKSFLESIDFHFILEHGNLNLLGEALDWSFWTDFNIISAQQADELIRNSRILELKLQPFTLFSQSLFRLFPEKHTQWFSQNKGKIINKLEEELNCSINLKHTSVKVTYKEFANNESPNDATMKRLNIIRSAIPFCQTYKGNHSIIPIIVPFLKLKHKYAYDPSKKEISAENLHFESDVKKNIILNEIVDSHFIVKTWYEFTQDYFDLRNDLILYCDNLCKRLKGGTQSFKKVDAPYISEKILHSYKKLPIEIEELMTSFSSCRDTFNSFSNFLLMKSNIVSNEFDEDSKRLLFLNYNNFLIQLPRMQTFFEQLKTVSPEYFEFEKLVDKENRIFQELKELLIINIRNSQIYWDLSTENH